MATSTTRKPKKSLKLSKDQIEFLRKERVKFESRFQASIHFGVDAVTVDRIIQVGSCSEKTYNRLLKIKGFKELED